MKKVVEISAETAAALVMACTAIEDILCNGELTEETAEELRYLQPQLNDFLETA